MDLWNAGAFWSALAGALAGALAALAVGPFVARRGVIRQKRLEIYDDLIPDARRTQSSKHLTKAAANLRKATTLAGRYEQKTGQRIVERSREIEELGDALRGSTAQTPGRDELEQSRQAVWDALLKDLDDLEEYLRKRIT